MSTRCLTEVRSRWEGEKEFETRAVIYRHHDGYLSGHGQWLYEFLNGLAVVNGIAIGKKMPERYANGPGRLASQLVAAMNEAGFSPNLTTPGPHGQEYHYVVDVDFGMNGGKVSVTVYDGPMTAFGAGGEDCANLLFKGTVEEFGEFLAKSGD